VTGAVPVARRQFSFCAKHGGRPTLPRESPSRAGCRWRRSVLGAGQPPAAELWNLLALKVSTSLRDPRYARLRRSRSRSCPPDRWSVIGPIYCRAVEFVDIADERAWVRTLGGRGDIYEVPAKYLRPLRAELFPEKGEHVRAVVYPVCR
jgi:hypothetical protein